MYNQPLAVTGVAGVGAFFWAPLAVVAIMCLCVALYRMVRTFG